MKQLYWKVGGAGLALSAAIGGTLAIAADHKDSTVLAMEANAASDINDVYAWMSADEAKVNLVMTVLPFAADGATFSPNVDYAIHVASAAAFGGAATNTDIICRFASATSAQCWVGDEAYVTGDPSATAGIESDGVKVFAGLRKDPFFFNLDGFVNAVGTVKTVAGDLDFDANGCPAVGAENSAALVNQLQTDEDGSEATDDFATANTLAIVLEIDKALLTDGGPILAVWASTHEQP